MRYDDLSIEGQRAAQPSRRGELPRHVTRGAVIIMAAVTLLRGCSCGGSDTIVPLQSWSCEEEGRRPTSEDLPCPNGDRFVNGVCAAVRCDAGGAGNCCPGSICTGGGECQIPTSRLTDCTSDAQCEQGQKCLERPRIKAESKTCGYPPTDAEGACPDGGQPFNQRCVDKTPCDGGCDAGQVCNIDLNRCEAPPAGAAGCNAACGANELLVFADPDNMLFDQCCAVSCACLPTPSLTPGAWGRFSDLAVTSTEVLVSGYDTIYGDLVMGRFTTDTGEELGVDYIDGVPSAGPVVANPAGPRGGRTEPGPDVGQYTSLALSSGSPRITYYDVDAGALRYAEYTGTSWQTSLIDDGRDGDGEDTGDVGRFSSLVIDANGIAHVVYYAHRVDVSGAAVTGPIYARAKSAAPGGYDDWERVFVEAVDSCNGACSESQACVLGAAGPTCMTTRTDCDPGCGCDEDCVDLSGSATCKPRRPAALLEPCDGHCATGTICVSDGGAGTVCASKRDGQCSGCQSGELCVDDGAGGAACRRETPYSLITGLPEGVGLFASLVLHNGIPTVAYYDRLHRLVRGAVGNFDGGAALGSFASLPVVCDADDDVGQHVTMAASAGTLHIVYQAGDGSMLMHYSGDDLFTGATEILDDGLRDGGGIHLVGGHASIAFGSGGKMYVAYADQTDNDLVLAYESTSGWKRTVVLSDGAYGSFARVAIANGRAYVSTYQRENPSGARDDSKLVLTLVDLAGLP